MVDRAALAEDKPSGHSLVHLGPGLAPELPAADGTVVRLQGGSIPDETSSSLPTNSVR